MMNGFNGFSLKKCIDCPRMFDGGPRALRCMPCKFQTNSHRKKVKKT